MRSVRVINGQSLLDIAIQEYGDVSYLFQILKDNPTLSLNSNVNTGDTLLVDETLNGEPTVKAVFQERKSKDINPINYSDFEGGSYNQDYNNDYDISN